MLQNKFEDEAKNRVKAIDKQKPDIIGGIYKKMYDMFLNPKFDNYRAKHSPQEIQLEVMEYVWDIYDANHEMNGDV